MRVRTEIGRSDERDSPSLTGSLDAESDREMRLASADGACEQDILATRDPIPASQLRDLGRGEAFGGAEIELVQGLHLGECGGVQSLLDRGLRTGRDLDGENLVEVVLVGPVLLARLSGEIRE